LRKRVLQGLGQKMAIADIELYRYTHAYNKLVVHLVYEGAL
jgi:hypothetical protein